MASVSVIEAGRPLSGRRSLLRTWRGSLQGSEFAWAIAFLHPLRRRVPGVCGLSDRLRSLARPQSGPLFRVVERSDISDDDGKYHHLSGDWRQRQDVRGTPAVRLLYAPRLVGQGALDDLCAALGSTGIADLHLDPLDAQQPMGPGQQCALRFFPIDGPGWLDTSRWLALGAVIVSYIWKNMPSGR